MDSSHGTIRSYTIGFVLSILLTLAAYFAVVKHMFAGWILIAIIMGYALTQFVVQLIFFLHLGRESKPRWNLVMLLSTVAVVLIIVVGSLWITSHLDRYHPSMTPAQMDTYMRNQEGL